MRENSRFADPVLFEIRKFLGKIEIKFLKIEEEMFVMYKIHGEI